MSPITSLQNPKIKAACKLRDRRDRDQTQKFLIEGFRELLRAKQGGVQVETLFVCEPFFLGVNEKTLIKEFKSLGTEIIDTAPHVFEKLSYRDRPDGLLGIAPQKHSKLSSLNLKEPPFLIVAEGIEKPGNLGTILRSSDAAGVDALIVCDKKTDLFNPNVVRASVGTLFTVPTIEATTEETLRFFKEKGIKILAATPHAEKLYTDVDLKQPLALIVGTEQIGLTDTWMSQADLQVKIPMHGVADSLNVATATTLLLFEVVRQRRC
jgi:TrmH family RNA methyltransferase